MLPPGAAMEAREISRSYHKTANWRPKRLHRATCRAAATPRRTAYVSHGHAPTLTRARPTLGS